MTNIKCSSNCVYQQDGECVLNDISKKKSTPNSNCAYYEENR